LISEPFVGYRRPDAHRLVRSVNFDAISAATGEVLKAGKGPRRPGDPPVLIANADLAKAELGFKPRYSDLPIIVATAWAWHRRAHPKKLPKKHMSA